MPGNPTRIIGIDPGLQNTGWGIVDFTGSHIKFIACGTIASPAKADTAERLQIIFTALSKILDTHHPHLAAVEESFISSNANSALKLGMARGIALLAPALGKIPVTEYSARGVKKAITGTGTADKNQILQMVKRLLPGCTVDSDHAADALALAICHGNHQGNLATRLFAAR